MPLSKGQRLGPYEILEQVGAGGMGQVYRAYDTRLNRTVAIKTSNEQFSKRFEREARSVAALNHPNICTLYDIGSSPDVPGYLVMEFVDGASPKGPLPADEVLRIARQLASALEAAHEQGIIHRDLKPANIIITREGAVKVLDFGLAKTAFVVGGIVNENSPTFTTTATEAGIILGTAAYMSPEQARGKEVDKRADIWAFGVVLYELVTGRQAFKGEDLTEILAAVVKEEPDWSPVPASFRPLLQRCLEKDPRKRLRDIGDFEMLAIPNESAMGTQSSGRSGRLGWILAGLLSLFVIAGLAWLRTAPSLTDFPRLALTIVPPPNPPLDPIGRGTAAPDISPDGTAILYRAGVSLYVRKLDSLTATLVPGSNRVSNMPFWSADSTSVFYPSAFSPGGLMKVRLPDGAPEMVMPLASYSRSGSSNHEATIILSMGNRLHLLAAPGSNPAVLDVPGLKDGRLEYPEFLPDGENFIFLWIPGGDSAKEVHLASLKEGKVVNPTVLLKNDTAARYTPAGGGRILFVRNDNLYAQKLDLNERKLVGDSQLIEEHVGSGPQVGLADFSVSRSGIIAWRPGTAALSQITAFDRKGMVVGTTGPPLPVQLLRLSPDETRLLAMGERSWLLDVGQPGRLDLGATVGWIFWSSDGSKLFGIRPSSSTMVERSLKGSDEVHELGPLHGMPQDLSPDGTQLLIFGKAIGLQPLKSTTDSEFKLLVEDTSGDGILGQTFSPDGRWFVYRAGGGIFVQPFPGPGLRRQIASQGGEPRWRADGKEIVFVNPRGELYSIRVDAAGGELRFGMPELLFSGLRFPAGMVNSSRPLAVSRDGSKIFWPQPVEQPGSNMIHVRTNALN